MTITSVRNPFLSTLDRLTKRRNIGTSAGARLPAPAPDALLLQWWAFIGLLLFVSVLLGRHNVWGILKNADPTGITMVILVVFAGATIWCGRRSHVLAEERRALDHWIECHRSRPAHAAVASSSQHQQHATDYLHAIVRKRDGNQLENGQLTEVLAERLHGPSEGAWWVNGILIKLGLLGKVIGFSILALQISQIESFDPSQTQTLLKSLTGGLGVALLTTAVGLIGNILLGFQLVRLDRCADAILADALYFVETELPPVAA